MGIIAALVCALAVLAALPALAADACGRGELTGQFSGDTLSLRWEGHVNDQMARNIAAVFDKRKTFAKAVTLSLNSCGGDLRDMQTAIVVLETIRSRVQFTTEVRRGDKCASACVPIFLAGKRRIGALASLFYFHPVVVQRGDPGTTAEFTRAQYRAQLTDEIIQRYSSPLACPTSGSSICVKPFARVTYGKPGATCGRARAASSPRRWTTSNHAMMVRLTCQRARSAVRCAGDSNIIAVAGVTATGGVIITIAITAATIVSRASTFTSADSVSFLQPRRQSSGLCMPPRLPLTSFRRCMTGIGWLPAAGPSAHRRCAF